MHGLLRLNPTRTQFVRWTLLSLFLVCGIASAQNYQITPRSTYEESSVGNTVGFVMDVTNLTADTQVLFIHHYSVNLPSDWDNSVCTGSQCYGSFVDSIQMSLPPMGQDSITLDIDVYSEGSGTAGIFVWQERSDDTCRVECTVSTSSSISGPEVTPKSYTLSSVYPNPFNSNTKLRFSLPLSGIVNLTMYDRLGRKINHSSVRYSQGTSEVALGNWFVGLPSGLYFIHFDSPFEQRTHRIEYIR